MKSVHIVWHDGPMGNSVIGVFSTKKKAELRKKSWDKEHSCTWDHAAISEHSLDADGQMEPAAKIFDSNRD